MLFMGILLISVFFAFILGSIIVKAQNNQKANADNIKYTSIVIDDGDSLWDIAEAYIDYSHYNTIYEYMDALKSINGMTSNNVFAGQNFIVLYYSNN